MTYVQTNARLCLLTSEGSTRDESGRAVAAQEGDGSRAGELAGFPLDGEGLAGGDRRALGGGGHDGVTLSLAENRGGKGQGGSENGGRTHLVLILDGRIFLLLLELKE